MVERRDGDEVGLMDSSIRTVGGALVSTPLYVLSGIVYAAVTSPAATGTFFFVSIATALVLRPIRGISQTLQKIGSEPGETVGSYLGVALLFAAGYLIVGSGVATVIADTLTRRTVFTEGLLVPVGVYAASLSVSMIVLSLLGAIGYPSAQTWLGGAHLGVQLLLIVIFDAVVASAAELLLVNAGVRLALFVPVGIALGVIPRIPGRHAVTRAWKFAKWSIPDQILDRFSYNMPVFVLGVVGTPAAVGIYEAADRFADFGATISWRLSSPLLTKVSGDAASGNDYDTYLRGAITGGTGVTFVVFGYLLSAHGIVAQIAFAEAQRAFSTTVLIVGGVNILRGFWTLTSHAMEGLGKPSVSFRTKLYGLVVSVPIPALFGAEFGALAGAVGYGVMNLVVFVYVCYYARDVLGYIPVDRQTTLHLLLGGVVGSSLTFGVVAGATRSGLSPTGVAVTAAVACLAGFGGVLLAVSTPTRVAARRVVTMLRGRSGNRA
ncbi:MAG: lipopolysaccharide biosynthesis protein [Halobellus sp.]|uniref:lipopolysaccharide biosynthesis protein n=1 Tax=Halobellus sp. TaxID=1979212 RepID=UPI0035D47DD6